MRRLSRSDYHDVFEPLADRSVDRVPFPFEYHASAVLEVSLRPAGKLDGVYGAQGLIDVRLYSPIREFDILVNHVLARANSWKGTLCLVQNMTNLKVGFTQVEFYLPALSPAEPIYRYEWKEGGSSQDARGAFSFSQTDKSLLDAMTTLIARDYSSRIHAHDGRETPLSLAYSRYMEILNSYGSR